MAVSDELLVKVKIDTSGSTVAVKDLTVSLTDLKKAAAAAGDSTEGSGKSFSKLAASAISLNQAVELAGKAYRALMGPIDQSIKAFAESEKVQTTLIYTLKALGMQADAAFADLQGFAQNLQKTSTVSDETSLSLASMAKSMGLSNAQTKQVIKASADMAAVMGTDVSSAFNELIGQYSGVTGRSAKYVVGLKDLNETQLKTGKGIELVAQQFAGFAEVQSKTLAGAMAQSKIAFEDIFEESGKVLSQFFDLPAAITSTKDTFVAIAKSIENFGERLQVLKTELQKIPWDTFVRGAGLFAAALTTAFVALNASAIMASLGSIGSALMGVAAPAAIVAVKFTLIAAAVLGVVIAVETLVVNFQDLDPLIALIGGAFVNMFERVVRGFASIGIAGLSAVEMVLEPLSAVSETAEAGLKKVRSGMISLGNVAEEADKKVQETGESIKEISKSVKTGATLDLIVQGASALKKAFGETETKVEDVNKAFNDTSRIAAEALKPTKEQLALLSQIKIENLSIGNQIKAMSTGRGAQILEETKLLQMQSAEKLRQLEVDGKLAGPVGNQIKKGLEDQLNLQIAKLQPIKEQLEAAKQLVSSNLALEVQAQAASRTEIENLDAQYSLLVAQTSEKLRQLEIDGMLGGETGKAIIDGLVRQLELQQQINDEKKMKAAESALSKMNPVAENVGKTALDAGKAFNSAVVPALNDMFGTSIKELSASTIASFAIASGKFFDSFEGFMAGSANIVGAGITAAASGIDKLLGTSFADGASAVGDAFAGAAGVVGGILDGFVSVLAKVFDPKFVQGVADSLGSLVEALPDLLIKAFDALAEAFEKIIGKLPEIVDKLMSALSGILDKLFAMAPKLIDSLADALTKFLDRLPELTQKLFSALPGIIDKLFSRLPDIIKSLFKAIPQIITQFIQAIPGIITGIVDHIPEIVMELVSGIIGAMGEIVAAMIDFILGGGLEKIVGAILRMIPKLVVAFVKGVINGLVRAFGAIFGGIKAPAFIQDMGNLPKKFEKGIKDLSRGVAKEASKVFKVLDMEGEAAAIQRLSEAKSMPDMIAAAADLVGKSVTGLWERLLNALKKVWEWVVKILTPVFEFLKKIWDAVYNNILKPFITALKTVWDAVYNNIIKPFLSALKAVWDAVYNNIIKPSVQLLQTLWDGVKAMFASVTAAFKVLWDGVGFMFTTVTNAFKTLWNGVKAMFDGVILAFKGLWEGVKIVWDGIIAAFRGVADIFVNMWATLKTVFTDAFSGIKDFFSNIFKGKISEAFQGIIETFKKIGSDIWNGLKDAFVAGIDVIKGLGASIWEGLKAAWTTGIDAVKGVGTKIWDGLKDAFTNGAKTIAAQGAKMWDGLKAAFDGQALKDLGTDIWNGLKKGLGGFGKVIQDALNAISPSNLFNKMFNFNDTSGEGTVEKTLGIKIPYANFAGGGLVPGNALVSGDSAMNDRVVALLSPGEAVIPRSKMDNPEIRSLVDSIMSGDFKPPKHFLGIPGTGGGYNPFDGSNPLGPVFDGLSGAAKNAFGPIAGVVSEILSPENLQKLGDSITSGAVNLKKSPLGDIAKAGDITLSDARRIGQAAGNTISGIGKSAIDASQEAVNDAIAGAKTAAQRVAALSRYVDPRYLWNLAKEKAFGSVIDGMENHPALYHNGGVVKGYAQGGDVSALLQPGEFVMQRSATNRIGVGALNAMNQGGGAAPVTINIELGGIRIDASSQSLDETYVRSKLIPSIKEELKKASLRGDFLLSDRGLRTTG